MAKRTRFLWLCVWIAVAVTDLAADDTLRWRRIADLPGTPGLGGPFVGAHGRALVVAGGANFPDAPPWAGGKKVWHGDIRVWLAGESRWRTGFRLERPLAYGAAVSTDDGVLLIGGCDAERVHADVSLLRWDGDRPVQEALPSLPVASAFLAAARIDGTVYVAAGQRTPDPTTATRSFFAFDLAARSWQRLPPWPGPARIKAVAAAQSAGATRKFFYLFSGEIATRRGNGDIDRRHATDAYRYDPDRRAWKRLARLPRPVAAGCGIDFGQSHILAFSGDTGANKDVPIQDRPAFTRSILAYHTITDTWVDAGRMLEAVVTTGITRWNGAMVIASGETRPGVRTPRLQVAEPAGPAVKFGVVNQLVLAAYLLALVIVGSWFARRERSTNDFFLAGRRIPWWAAGLSIYATQLSAITFVSVPALAYATDWLVAPGYVMILVMAPVVIAFFLPFFRRLNVTTAYQYLERRFNLAVRLFGSASFIAFQLGRMAVVVYLPALALAAVTGIDIYLSILLMGLLATVYTVLGGIEAVVWTDVVQVIVLLGGMLVSLVVIGFSDGVSAAWAAALADGKLTAVNASFSFTELATWSILLGTLMLQFGPYTTDQAVVQRYLTTRDERAAARGIWVNGILSIPSGLLFFVLGTGLYVFFKSRPELLTVGMPNDQIFPLFVAQALPPGISGLVIAGVFAASMSTLDSSMHSIATAVTTDFYRRFRPAASDRHCLRLARGLIVFLGAAAVGAAWALAAYDIRSLFFFFQKLLGLVSSGLVGIFILGIFTRRAGPIGALVGAAAAVAVLVYVVWFTGASFYLYAVAGIGTCVAVGYAASLIFDRGVPDLTGLTYRSRPSQET